MIEQHVVDKTVQDLASYIKHGILTLQQTWLDIGISPEEQADKCDAVMMSLKSVLESLIIGENAWKTCLQEECDMLSGRCNENFKQLGLPTFDPQSVTLPLISKRDFLQKKEQDLNDEIQTKKNFIDELEEQKTHCIQRLGLHPDHYPTIQSDNIARIISSLEVQIKEFEDDMTRRTKTLHAQLNQLASLVDSLEVNRAYLIEEGLLADEPDTLLLSDESIQRRQDLIVKYKAQLNIQKQEALEIRHKIERLHSLLNPGRDLNEDTRELFNDPRPSSIARLQRLRESLEIDKKQNLDFYMKGLQEKIENYQKLCFQTTCTSSTDSHDGGDEGTIALTDLILENIENTDPARGQQQQHVADTSEQRLRQLEDDLDTWESFYRSNRYIFDMVTKWKELNDRYLELQTPSADRYNNRGGALLQSQKESSRISKEIPRTESKILSEIDKLDGEVIKINGFSIEDYFSEFRATTTLSRLSSVRKSKRKSVKKGEVESVVMATGVPTKTPSKTDNTAKNRKSLRRRVSKESGLDKVGVK